MSLPTSLPSPLAFGRESIGLLTWDGNHSDLIFDVAELVAWCSQGTTLPPGTTM